MGRHIVGVDRRAELVESLNAQKAPIDEPALNDRLERARDLGTLRATTSISDALLNASASFICVGTPTGADGRLDDADVLAAIDEICRALPPEREHIIVVRSTVPPGLYKRANELIRERERPNVSLALNPEFLREGSAISDLESPEMVVYATDDAKADVFLRRLYAHQDQLLHATTPSTAEVLKLVCNAWHALKVSFANEVARVAQPVGVDPFAVMKLLCQDTKLNTSAAYLRPGLPFGGACLVKDVAALDGYAGEHNVEAPVIGAILKSNGAHLKHLLKAILAHKPARVAVIRVGFKTGATDVRDSAPVRLVQRLLDQNIRTSVADSGVLAARIPPLGVDALKAALGDARAHACQSVEEAIEDADVVVVGHPSKHDGRALAALAPDAPILDIAGELARVLTEKERGALAHVVVLSERAVANVYSDRA